MDADAGVWKQVSTWLWLVLAPVVGVAWGMLNKRIDKAEKKAEDALPRDDFERFLEKHRADIKELFGRNDTLKDHVNARVETLRTDMHEGLGRLRDLMAQGFQDVRKELSDVLKAVSRRRD